MKRYSNKCGEMIEDPQGGWVQFQELGISGVIIKHGPNPDAYGGVAVKTCQVNYAVVREHQEKAKKNIGKKVTVKEHPSFYKTVMILDYESN